MSDVFDIHGEEQRAEAKASQSAQQTELLKNDLLWLMGNPRGRRFIFRLLERTGLYRSSFTGNSTTFFREGERNVGLWVQAVILEHAQNEYFTMLTERKDYQ